MSLFDLLGLSKPTATIVIGATLGLSDVNFLRIEFPRADRGLPCRNELVYYRIRKQLGRLNTNWMFIQQTAQPDVPGYKEVIFEFKLIKRPTTAELANPAALRARPALEDLLSIVERQLKEVGYKMKVA